jgi:hypothetical protein
MVVWRCTHLLQPIGQATANGTVVAQAENLGSKFLVSSEGIEIMSIEVMKFQF